MTRFLGSNSAAFAGIAFILILVGLLVRKVFGLSEVWEFLTVIGEFAIAWVIYHEIGEARKTARQEFIRRFFDEYATPEFFDARKLLESPAQPYTDLKSFREAFHDKLDEATKARRRIKYLLAWLGNLMERKMLSEEDVFFVDLPYRLYKGDNGEDGPLLRVEKDLLKETKTDHL
jgi:hypothetical protein